MKHPLLSVFIEAICSPKNNLNKLSYLVPVFDGCGQPQMICGDESFVFKMKDRNNRFYALKCFINEKGQKEAYRQIGLELRNVPSCYFVPFKYYDQELMVNTDNGKQKYSVLLMEWVEGNTLDSFIRDHINDEYSLSILVYQFCLMASWLISQPFSHGNLNPSNVIVKADESLVLIDYDNMFVSSMEGQPAREKCSRDYCHPLRTKFSFDKHNDDFSLATIAMQLYAISLQPNLLSLSKSDTLLLSKDDYLNLGKSQMFNAFLQLTDNLNFEKLLSLFLEVHSTSFLKNANDHTFFLENVRPKSMTKEGDETIDAVSKLIGLAGKDNAEAQKKLGDYYRDGIVVGKDYMNAFIWYNKAASLGEINAMGNIAYLYSNGLGVPKNNDEANKYYIETEKKGNPISKFNLGQRYRKGLGIDRDESKAESLFIEALPLLCLEDEQGNINSQHVLGLCYLYGYGVEKDETMAVSLFRKAAEHGHRVAQHNLAVCYLKGKGIERDCYKAIKWFCLSAMQGHSNAQLGLAKLYYRGDGIPQNYRESVKWSYLSAEQGNPKAQYLLAICYFTGRGVNKNTNKAFGLFKKAAETGLKEAQFALGKCYYFGQGITKNYKEAVNWFKISAGNGDPNAQFYLGNCYKNGLGVRPSIEIAKEWYGLAIAQGHNGAKSAFDECVEQERKIFEENEVISKNTKVTEEDIKKGVKDEYGVVYSKDWKRLLTANLLRNTTSYKIKPGTLVICDEAFSKGYGTRFLTSIQIPDSVKIIGKRSFAWCKSLQTIVIPNSVTKIGDYAFELCPKVTSIVLPDSIKMIGAGAFSDCKSIESLSLPKSLTEIGNNPFPSGISSVDCKTPFFTVDDKAIYTKDMKEIVSYYGFSYPYTIPNSVTHIRKNAFSRCYLRSIVIPDNVKTIGDYAFSVSGIRTIELPDSLPDLGEGAFYYCKKLSDIKLPCSIKRIPDFTFNSCERLQSIVIPDNVTRLGNNAFEMCCNLQSIIIPNSIESIGSSCFAHCTNLESLVIPENVKEIGNYAFSGSGLRSIVLPNSITSIGTNIFFICFNLKSIIIPKGSIERFKEMLSDYVNLLKEID